MINFILAPLGVLLMILGVAGLVIALRGGLGARPSNGDTSSNKTGAASDDAD
jgi:hypothetical protein